MATAMFMRESGKSINLTGMEKCCTAMAESTMESGQ